MPYYLIGHSGGEQFLSRFAAFVPNEAERIVLANPGTYLFPDLDRAFPYGFGGLSPALGSDERLHEYLAAPITIFLGTEDLFRYGLNKSRGAERQGLSRYERGFNAFNAARKAAAARGETSTGSSWRRLAWGTAAEECTADPKRSLPSSAMRGAPPAIHVRLPRR